MGRTRHIQAVVPEHAHEARRIGVEALLLPANHGIHRADGLRQRINIRQQGHHLLLVGNGDVEAVQGGQQLRRPGSEILTGDLDDAVICLDAQLPEDGLVDGPGQAVTQLFANEGVMLHGFHFLHFICAHYTTAAAALSITEQKKHKTGAQAFRLRSGR